MQTLRYVVGPQALRLAVPSLSNSLISLIKVTSLVSVIAVSELMLATREAIATTFQPFPLYIAAAATYWARNASFERLQKKLESRLNRSCARLADQADARYTDSKKPVLPRSGRWLEPA